MAKTPIGHAIVIRNGYEVWRYGDAYGRADGWWASSSLDLVIARLGTAPKEHNRIDEFLGPIVAAVALEKSL